MAKQYIVFLKISRGNTGKLGKEWGKQLTHGKTTNKYILQSHLQIEVKNSGWVVFIIEKRRMWRINEMNKKRI